jgi:hypothetical protein
MFKVSFKDDCMKVQTFNDRATIVTMVGKLSMPEEIWDVMSSKVIDWMWHHPSVDAQWSKGTKYIQEIRLEFSGKSVCSQDDTFNAETGRRIAESRAKIKLYKFMHNLCENLIKRYYDIMYGNAEIGHIIESHTEAPKDCLYLTCQRYRELWVKESHHLGKLLEEA